MDVGSPPIKTIEFDKWVRQNENASILTFFVRRLHRLRFMKVKERAVARGLEKLYPQLGTLEEPEDQFSPFDFECDKYIIEVKCRSQAWDPWFIEAIKYNSNMEIAKNRKKDFIFLTEVNKTVYLYNISKLTRKDYDFKWTTKLLPNSTEFTKQGKSEKPIGYLAAKDATILHI